MARRRPCPAEEEEEEEEGGGLVCGVSEEEEEEKGDTCLRAAEGLLVFTVVAGTSLMVTDLAGFDLDDDMMKKEMLWLKETQIPLSEKFSTTVAKIDNYHRGMGEGKAC